MYTYYFQQFSNLFSFLNCIDAFCSLLSLLFSIIIFLNIICNMGYYCCLPRLISTCLSAIFSPARHNMRPQACNYVCPLSLYLYRSLSLLRSTNEVVRNAAAAHTHFHFMIGHDVIKIVAVGVLIEVTKKESTSALSDRKRRPTHDRIVNIKYSSI